MQDGYYDVSNTADLLLLQTSVVNGTKRHPTIKLLLFLVPQHVSDSPECFSAARSEMTPLTLVSHLITLCFLLLCFRS